MIVVFIVLFSIKKEDNGLGARDWLDEKLIVKGCSIILWMILHVSEWVTFTVGAAYCNWFEY